MPPKAKSSKDKKLEPSKADKSKKPSEDSKKLKAATAVKVRHILCEKQSKGTVLAELPDHQVLEAMAKIKDVSSPRW
jgi:hypothetical protein